VPFISFAPIELGDELKEAMRRDGDVTPELEQLSLERRKCLFFGGGRGDVVVAEGSRGCAGHGVLLYCDNVQYNSYKPMCGKR
jgi:hypothetical protein